MQGILFSFFDRLSTCNALIETSSYLVVLVILVPFKVPSLSLFPSIHDVSDRSRICEIVAGLLVSMQL